MKSSVHDVRELSPITPPSRRRFTALLAAALVSLATWGAVAHDGTGVFPINSHPYGKSYGEWSVAWWQWALGIPAASSPVTDTTGQFAGVGQNGPVWFMGGTFGSDMNRTFTIPAGKALLLPVAPWIFGAIAGDCAPSNPGVTCDVPTLRDAAAAAATAVQTMLTFVDGKPVDDLRDYRALSPGGFDVTIPPGAVLGLPTGTFGPHVADGYWLILKPLKPGAHTITQRVINPAFGVNFTLTYNLTVQEQQDRDSEPSE